MHVESLGDGNLRRSATYLSDLSERPIWATYLSDLSGGSVFAGPSLL